MKKTLLATLVLATLALLSCGNNGPDVPDTPHESDPIVVEASVSEFSWYGDQQKNGIHRFHITLIEDIVDLNGYTLHLELNAASIDPCGNYIIGENAVGTILAGDNSGETLVGSYVAMSAGGAIEGSPKLLNGDDCYLSIERIGENYAIVFSNNEYKFKASFDGKIRNEAFPYEPMEATNFTASFNLGRALYYGDLYGHGVSEEYLIDFEGDNYASIDLYAPLNSSDSAIPDGTYTISTTGAPGTITPGGYDRYFSPSYVYLAVGGQTISTVWYMYSGSLTFVNNDGIYTVTGLITSACGSQIVFNYNGPIEVEPY
ncbi:MAG: hypothetical protein MJZ96_00965 [Paludibacteraceae bacterium]|nr:hypothetical protein [Paludibacteraceae bacterium]